jgi:hypothetical protein
VLLIKGQFQKLHATCRQQHRRGSITMLPINLATLYLVSCMCLDAPCWPTCRCDGPFMCMMCMITVKPVSVKSVSTMFISTSRLTLAGIASDSLLPTEVVTGVV